METDELESRLNQMMGNMMGMQTLLLSVIATSGKRTEILSHFREEAETANAVFIQSRLPDEAIAHFARWVSTTFDMLADDETPL